jgi:hypothetical protein
MRLKSVLLDENPAPLKEHVEERLDAVHERLHRHAPGIEAMNEYLEKQLRGWAAANSAVIEKLRRKATKPAP